MSDCLSWTVTIRQRERAELNLVMFLSDLGHLSCVNRIEGSGDVRGAKRAGVQRCGRVRRGGAEEGDPPRGSCVVRRRMMRRLSLPTSFQPLVEEGSSSEVSTRRSGSSGSCDGWGMGRDGGRQEEEGSERGGGGMSSKKESC